MSSPVGLTNKSVDFLRKRLCSLNCILQILYNIPLFRETVLNKLQGVTAKHPLFALQTVFQEIKNKSEQPQQQQGTEEDETTKKVPAVVNSKIIVDSLGQSLDEFGETNDIDELFCYLKEAWTNPKPANQQEGEEETDKESLALLQIATQTMTSTIDLLFNGVSCSKISSADPETTYSKVTHDMIHTASLPIRSGKEQLRSLDECYKKVCEPELLTGDDQLRVDITGGERKFIDANIQRGFSRLPPVLINHVKRFDIESGPFGYQKVLVKHEVSFPQVFDASSYEKEEDRFDTRVFSEKLISEAQKEAQIYGYPSLVDGAKKKAATLTRQEDYFPTGTFYKNPVRYNLFAVVQYGGDGRTWGHHVVNVLKKRSCSTKNEKKKEDEGEVEEEKKEEERWIHYDDEDASLIESKDVEEKVFGTDVKKGCIWVVYVREGCEDVVFSE